MHPPNIHKENPDSKYPQIEQKGNKSDCAAAHEKGNKSDFHPGIWRCANLRNLGKLDNIFGFWRYICVSSQNF